MDLPQRRGVEARAPQPVVIPALVMVQKPGQLCRVARAPRQQRGRADRQQRGAPQRANLLGAGAVPAIGQRPHCKVEAVAVQIDAALAGRHRHLDAGMQRPELRQPGDDERLGDECRRRHEQRPPLLAAAQGLDPGGEGAESLVQTLRQPSPRLGQPDAAPGALHQRHPQLALQRADLLRDGRMGDVQHAAGAGKTAMARRGIEGPQGRERGQGAPWLRHVSSTFVLRKFLIRSFGLFMGFVAGNPPRGNKPCYMSRT